MQAYNAHISPAPASQGALFWDRIEPILLSLLRMPISIVLDQPAYFVIWQLNKYPVQNSHANMLIAKV